MKRIKVITSLLLIVVVAIATCFSAFAVSDNYANTINSAIKIALQYKQGLMGADDSNFLDKLSEKADDFSVDWYYILLSRYGVNCNNTKSINTLKERVDSFYDKGLENTKVTDMHRTALALISCGADITSLNGNSFLADCTYNYNAYSSLDKQGVNGLAFALIVLDSKNFTVPKNAKLSRLDIVNQILDKELENGGFAITGSVMDADVTAIVLQALAPYYDNKNVKVTVDRCIENLSKLQQDNGAYRSLGKENAESTAQVIIALTSLNINPLTDKRFIKNGNSTVDALLSFQQSNGGFCHIKGYMSDNIATYQSLCGLISCYRYLKGESRFFSYSAVNNTVTTATQNTVSVTEKATKKPTEPTETKAKKKYKTVKYNTILKFNKPQATEKTEQTTIQETTVAVTNQTDGYYKINHSNYTQTETLQRTRAYDFATGFLLLLGYIILFIVKTKGRKV
ncbi:MAG: prenyltransferase/squalene oxidase repeat-containing protein [Ruminococcus sp.]